METCQPTLASQAPAGPGWIHEIKQDGYRLIARREGERVRLWSRNQTDFTEHFSGIVSAMRQAPADVVFDGEAVVFHPDGHSAFDALRSREGGSRAVMVAFEVLEVDGFDFRREPLVSVTPAVWGLRASCRSGWARNRAGRTTDWLKIKNRGFLGR